MLVLQSSLSLLMSTKVSPRGSEKFVHSCLACGPENPSDVIRLSQGMFTRYLHMQKVANTVMNNTCMDVDYGYHNHTYLYLGNIRD